MVLADKVFGRVASVLAEKKQMQLCLGPFIFEYTPSR
jgi:hypothetical protein